jgi:O-antigen/teichoic acid export membrane protein
MAMALSFMGLVDTFVDLGFLSAIIQAKEINRKQLSSCFWLLTLMALFFSVSGFLLAPFISEIYLDPNLSGIIKWMVPILLFSPWNIVCKGILSRDIRLDTLAKIELYAGIVKMTVTIFLAYIGMGVSALLIGYMVERVLQTIACAMTAQWYPRFEYDKSCLRPFLDFGSKSTASSLLWYIFTKADVFVIGRILGAEVLGVYTIASQFPQTIARLVPTAWMRIAYPLFSKYQQTPELKQIVSKSSFLLNLLCLPLFLGMAAIAPDIINLVFGQRWHEAIFPLQMLSVAAAIETATGVLPSVLNAIGRPGVNTVINMVAVIVFPLSLYWGAQQWGMYGVLWVTVMLYAYRYAAFLLATCRLLKLSTWVYLKDQLGSVVYAISMFGVVLLCSNNIMAWNIYLRVSLCIVIGAVLYPALHFIFNKKRLVESFMYFKTL